MRAKTRRHQPVPDGYKEVPDTHRQGCAGCAFTDRSDLCNDAACTPMARVLAGLSREHVIFVEVDDADR